MADKVKFDIEVETKKAKANIDRLEKEFKELGGAARLAQVKGIKKLESGIKTLGGRAQKSAGVFSKFTKGIALGNIAAVAATAAFRMLKDSVKHAIDVGIEHERVYNDVAASLRRYGAQVDIVLPKVQEFTDRMQTLSGISDEKVAVAFQRVNDMLGDVEASMSATQSAMDLSVAKGMDLATTADLIAKSITSSTNALSRYGIEIDKSLPKQEQMRQLQEQIDLMFGGAAAARMDAFAGKVALLGNTWDDFLEEITTPTGTLGKIVSSFIMGTISLIRGLAGVLSGGVDVYIEWANVLKKVFKTTGDNMGALWEFAKIALNPVNWFGGEDITAAFATFATQLNVGFDGVGTQIVAAVDKTKGQVVKIFDEAGKAGSAFWLEFYKPPKVSKLPPPPGVDDADAQKAARERQIALKKIADISFEAGLIGLSKFKEEEARINKFYDDQEAIVKASKGLTDAEVDRALYENELLRIDDQNKLKVAKQAEQDILEREMAQAQWDALSDIAHGAQSAMDAVGIEMSTKAFDRLMQFKDGIDAVSNGVKVLTSLNTNFTAGMYKVVASMWAAVSASAAWIATQVKMISKTIAAAAVAAAKAVASIPIIGPGLAIAAAAAVAAGLAKLVGAFDDPRNDAVAFKWGKDAGVHFMKGLTEETGAPHFGERVIGSMRGAGPIETAVAPVNITIQVIGDVNEDAFRQIAQDTLGPVLEELSINGFSNLETKDTIKVMR